MKYFSYFTILFVFVSCDTIGQKSKIIKEDKKLIVDIKDYFFLNEGDIRIYKCQYIPPKIVTNGVSNNYTDVVTVYDSVLVKSILIDSIKHYYFWEYDPPLYMIGLNTFLGGISVFKEQELYFKAIEYEGDLIEVNGEQLNVLFPEKIESGIDYNTIGVYTDKITFRLIDKKNVIVEGKEYDNCIILTQTNFYDRSKDIDTLWFAPQVGLIKIHKSTGRKESLVSFHKSSNIFESHIIDDNEKKYVNGKGKVVYESQLSDAHKFEGDYSTATYNSYGYLIKEEFWGEIGEMRISYILYNYDTNNNLIEELYYYEGRKNNKGEMVYKIWVNEFAYSTSNKLIGAKYKLDINDSKYYKTSIFKESDDFDVNKLRYSRRHRIKKE